MIGETWRRRPGPLPDRLAAELREQISRGRIGPGATLPAERELARRAGVSRTTASAALDRLVAEGWARRRNRARTVARLPDASGQPLAPAPSGHPDLDLVGAMTSAPAELVDDAVDRARAALRPLLLGDGRPAGGLGPLREAVAARFTTDGVPTTADEVLITNGALGALAAVLDGVPGPVLVEDPTYHVALRLLAARQRRLVPWPRMAGWNPEGLARAVAGGRPALAYLVPDFHNPTGFLADDAQREGLAGHLGPVGTVVVDETLRPLDLRLGPDGVAPPLPRPVAHHLPGAVTIGGLSKVVWSGLRIGWLRDPHPDRRAGFLRFTEVQPAPVLDQLVALELWDRLETLATARIIRLRRQRDHLAAGLGRAGLTVAVPPGGLVLWVDLGRPVATDLARHLAGQGVQVAPGGMFGVANPVDGHLRLPFTHDVATLDRAIGAVVDGLAALAPGGTAGAGGTGGT